MDFKTKLNSVFNKLEFTNIDVARHGGPDASLISRFRNGKRIPSCSSNQFHLLCLGIVLLAKKEDKLKSLSDCCNLTSHETNDLVEEFSTWLCPETLHLKSEHCKKKDITKASSPKREFIYFPEKMDLLMNTFNISNSSLAKSMHIDASLVSRFRTGVRKPAPGSWFPPKFCFWMAEKALTFPSDIRQNNLKLLICEPIPDNAKELGERILDWIYTEPKESQMLHRFLTTLDALEKKFVIPATLITSIKEIPARIKTSDTFTGLDGLREAVKRFLILVALQPKPCTLYLYSDQPMDWMSNDLEFSHTWNLLMFIVLRLNNKICIIHNINRTSTSMSDALKKWIPLYMTGLVHSFVCKKELEETFHQTIFIAPGICSIDASFVVGTQDKANYQFSMCQSKIRYNLGQFEALMKISRPLHKTFTLESMPKYEHLESSSKFISTLSIATMPDDLFDQIITRNTLTQDQLAYAKKYRKKSLEGFYTSINKTIFTELVNMPNTLNILEESVKIDLPGIDIYYTSDEFLCHINHIMFLINDRDNYLFYPLYESHFEDVIISVQDKYQTFVTKTDSPVTIFVFNDPRMNTAFKQYLHSLAELSFPTAYSKEKILAQLTDYITKIV